MTQCRRGNDCRGGVSARVTDRGLCLACEAYGQRSIGELVEDYVWLSINLPRSGGGFGAGIPTHRAEAPIPLRVEVDALMRKIVACVQVWERDVRFAARLSMPAQEGVRPQKIVERGVAILTSHYSTLLALRIPGAAVDGIDGIEELTNLHRSARSLVGTSRAWEWRELPCPGAPLSDGCGEQYCLGQWVGSDVIECVNCGWDCTTEDYQSYAMTFIPPVKRKSL